MAIPLGAEEGTFFPDGLDGEARLILDQLQGALDEVDLERATYNTNDYDDTDANNSDDDDEEDPDSGEHELADLMDSLVAELRADIQEQVVQEFDYDDDQEGIPQDQQDNYLPLTPEDTSITEDGETTGSRCTRSPGNQETFGTIVSEVSLPSTSKEGDPDHAPVLDHSDFGTPLDPAKKELLRRLLNHLNTGGVSIRRRLYQEQNLRQQQTKKVQKEDKNSSKKSMLPRNHAPRQEDRVYQEIPDLQSSPTPVQFDRLTPPDTTDPDFVAVQDFTPAKSSLSPAPPQPQHPPSRNNNDSKGCHEKQEKATRSDPPKREHISNQSSRQPSASNITTTPQYRRQRERQRRRRTNKHKASLVSESHDNKSNSTNLSKQALEGEGVAVKSVSNTDDTSGSSYRYYDDYGASEDTIRRIADSDTWKRICQLVFRPSPK